MVMVLDVIVRCRMGGTYKLGIDPQGGAVTNVREA